MQVAGMAPKKERKNKKDKEGSAISSVDGKLKFAERVKVLLKNDGAASPENLNNMDDPYTFSDASLECSHPGRLPTIVTNSISISEVGKEQTVEISIKPESPKANCVLDKNKSNVIRSPKTMKRLEAKIARNKMLDKLKKSRSSEVVSPCARLNYNMNASEEPFTDDISSSVKASPPMEMISTPSSSPKPSTALPDNGRTSLESRRPLNSVSKSDECASVISRTPTTYRIYPIKRPKILKWRHPHLTTDSVNTLQRIWEDDRDFKADVFPLGKVLTLKLLKCVRKMLVKILLKWVFAMYYFTI